MAGEDGNARFELYVPSALDEIAGNGEAIAFIKRFASDIDSGIRRKPLMLHGPSGTGKTLSAYLIAKQRSWHIVEMNAGDYRDSASINRVAMPAVSSGYLFGGRNLVLFDEVDELMPRFDNGAASAIEGIMGRSASPIIFIADNPWDPSIRFLRGKVDLVSFKKIGRDDIKKVLLAFTKGTGLELDAGLIELIAARSNGDVRSAMNDAWTMAGSGEEDISAIGMRNSKEEIFGVLDKIFKSYTLAAPLIAVSNSDEEGEMLIKWIEENVTKRYTGDAEIFEAMDNLSLSTMYHARASRSQYYTYWRYMNVLMSSGVALSKTHSPSMEKRYAFPKVIKSLSESKGERSAAMRIAEKLSRYVHAGRKRIAASEMRIVAKEARYALERGTPKEKVIGMMNSRFQLDEKELDYLLSVR